jgi:hypothetical protein
MICGQMQYIAEAERGHGILLFIQIILANGKSLFIQSEKHAD